MVAMIAGINVAKITDTEDMGAVVEDASDNGIKYRSPRVLDIEKKSKFAITENTDIKTPV